MGKKVRTTLTIDKDVLKTAMEIGINVSQFCENALKEAIQKLKSPPTATNGGKSLLGPASLSKEGGLVGRTGLEPATFCTSSRCPTELDYRPIDIGYFRFQYIATSSSLTTAYLSKT